jgi:hypothetical protein
MVIGGLVGRITAPADASARQYNNPESTITNESTI